MMDQLATSKPEDGLHESSTLFVWPEPSSLSVEESVPRVERAIQYVINNFEHLYQGIYGENKQVLINFKQWVSGHLKEFLTGEFKNVEIPGQLSLMIIHNESQVMIVSYEKRAYLSSLTQFISAVAAVVR